MPGGKGRTTNHKLHTLRDNFFVADPVLHGTNRALVIKDVRDLGNCDSSMDRLGRDDPIVAAWQIAGVAGRVRAGNKICLSGKSQAVLLDGVDVLLPNVVGPHFGFSGPCEMRGKQTAYGTTTDDANLHLRNTFLLPLSSGEKLPRHIRQALAFRVADSVSVLRIQTHSAIFIDDLRMQRENHVLLKPHIALRAN